MRMKDQVAIVTGAASGIGKEVAKHFAREGAKVCIADLSREQADGVVKEIEKDGGTAMAVTMNVTDENQVQGGIGAVIEAYGGIDVLMSNAGIQHIDPIEDLSFEDWKKTVSIHLDGGFLTTKACLPHMYKAGKGSVIYMGSVHSKEASPLKAPYVSAKHALLGLCKVVATEGAAHGVRSNIICPGFVRTPLVDKQIPEQAQDLGISEEKVVSDVMLKETVDTEFTTVEDIAELAVFLASFPTNALTGQSVIVSHGWHMQ